MHGRSLKLVDHALHLCVRQGLVYVVSDDDVELKVRYACRMILLKPECFVSKAIIHKMQRNKKPCLGLRSRKLLGK